MTREEAVIILDGFKNNPLFSDTHTQALDMAISALKGGWIPIVTRPMTEEEKEEYHGEYDPNDMTMYDCQMPEDGQEVLVTTRYGDVDTDTFYHDDGWYFENFCDDGDVLAWQPKPEPYKKGE